MKNSKMPRNPSKVDWCAAARFSAHTPSGGVDVQRVRLHHFFVYHLSRLQVTSGFFPAYGDAGSLASYAAEPPVHVCRTLLYYAPAPFVRVARTADAAVTFRVAMGAM